MGCHIYIYDKHNREIRCPWVRISSNHEGEKYTLQLDAHRFIAKVREEENAAPDMTPVKRVSVLEQEWRQEKVAESDRIAINLDWIVEIINRPDFGRLECG